VACRHRKSRLSAAAWFLRRFCQLDGDSQRLLKAAIDKLGLSARAHNRILEIARTIADLAGVEALTSSHIAEAIRYGSLIRTLA